MFSSSYQLAAMLQTEEEKSSTMLGVVFTDFNESILEMVLARLPAAGRLGGAGDTLISCCT